MEPRRRGSAAVRIRIGLSYFASACCPTSQALRASSPSQGEPWGRAQSIASPFKGRWLGGAGTERFCGRVLQILWGFPANPDVPAHVVVGADAHIGPRRMQCFYGNLRRIRNCLKGRCGHQPLQWNLAVLRARESVSFHSNSFQQNHALDLLFISSDKQCTTFSIVSHRERKVNCFHKMTIRTLFSVKLNVGYHSL